jgi:hypothetical protein
MPRRASSLARALWSALALAAAAGSFAGCALDDGEPWGRAQFWFSATFDDDGRADAAGALRTASDYRVEVGEIVMRFDTVTLDLRSEGTEVAGFDPANPPPGYSLCHNGHCHAADGALVDYEDIALEIGAAAGGTAAQVVVAIDGEAELEDGPVGFPTDDCSDDCLLEPGELASVALTASEVTFELTVYDRLEGERRRLPEGGVTVTATFPVALEWRVPVEGTVGDDAPIDVFAVVELAVTPHFLDLDWVGAGLLDGEQGEADLSESLLLHDYVHDALLEESVFTATITRTEP